MSPLQKVLFFENSEVTSRSDGVSSTTQLESVIIVVVTSLTTTLIEILSRWAGTLMSASLAFGSYFIVCLKKTPSSSNTSPLTQFSFTDDKVVVADADVDSVDVVRSDVVVVGSDVAVLGSDVVVVGSDVAVVGSDVEVVGDDVVGCVKGTGPKQNTF